MTNKCTLPAICYEPLQTEEELARAEEETLDLEREWLARHEQEQKQRKTRTKPETPNRLLRTKEAASYIGVSDWKLRQMVYDGEIEVIAGKYWRFDTRSLDHWIESNREKKL